MEKTLDAELGRILEKLEGGLAWGGQKEICYYWDSRYDERNDSKDWEDEEDEEEKYTPQEKYDLVLKALKPDGYEKMSLAEFNRKTHAALSEYDEIMDISYLYEMVLMELEEEQSRITNKTDADVKFLQTTVSNSMDEYYAAERSLYARKQIDPEYAVSINASRKEDVYGDEVVVDLAEGYYSFTYHILDADKLTVAERDKFLEDVVSEVQKRVDNADRGQKLDEAFLKRRLTGPEKPRGTHISNIQAAPLIIWNSTNGIKYGYSYIINETIKIKYTNSSPGALPPGCAACYTSDYPITAVT